MDTRTDYAGRVENMATLIDKMFIAMSKGEPPLDGRGRQLGSSREYLREAIDRIYRETENILKYGSQRAQYGADMARNEHERQMALSENEYAYTNGKVTYEQKLINEATINTRFGNQAMGLYKKIQKEKEACIDAIDTLNGYSKTLGMGVFAKEGSDPTHICDEMCAQYAYIGDAYTRTLLQQMNKGLDPAIIQPDVPNDHFDAMQNAARAAKNAVENAESLTDTSKRISGLATAHLDESHNLHIVKMLPSTITVSGRPQEKWIPFIMNGTDEIRNKRCKVYESKDVDNDGRRITYILLNEWQRVESDATMMFKGKIVPAFGGTTPGSGDWTRFTGRTKAVLDRLGFDTKNPESQDINKQVAIIEKGLKNKVLDTANLQRYFARYREAQRGNTPDREKRLEEIIKKIGGLAPVKTNEKINVNDILK